MCSLLFNQELRAKSTTHERSSLEPTPCLRLAKRVFAQMLFPPRSRRLASQHSAIVFLPVAVKMTLITYDQLKLEGVVLHPLMLAGQSEIFDENTRENVRRQ